MDKHNWNKVFGQCPEKFHASVNSALEEISNMEEKKMKKSWSRKAIITIVAVAALGVTAIGAGKVVSTYSSTNINDKIETTEGAYEKAKEAGIDLRCIDKFSNDYEFTGAFIYDVNYSDENDAKVGTSKALSADYENDGKCISLYYNKAVEYAEDETEYQLAESYNGADIYTYEWTNRSVPGDYKLTEQDKLDEANGDVVFSYGSNDIETKQVKVVKWYIEGGSASLMDMDSNVEMNELISMAEEVIDAQ